jgi:hypothetical protein
MNTCRVNTPTIPDARSVPKRSLASTAMRRPRQMKTRNRPSTAAAPMKPNSSPMTVKMKSVWFSGT